MNLTPQQEKMVSNFLRKAADEFRDLSAEERAESLSRIRSRMKRELDRLGDGTHTDEVVAKALLRSNKKTHRPSESGNGHADRPAPPQEKVRPKPPPEKRRKRPRRTSATESTPESGWLGVCFDLSDTARVPLSAVRGAFVVFGLLTWPFALWVYLGAYIVAAPGKRLREHGAGLVLSALQTCAWVVVLFTTGWGLSLFARKVYETYLATTLETGGLVWLPVYDGRIAIAALITSLPALLLATLPMANDWDVTLKRIGHTVIAVYAMTVFIGLICLAVGTGIQAVADFTG